jgi:6,7-dimethyl-8-ribityllumazine synthase
MPRELTATPAGDGLRIGIAVSRFNQSVTDQLVAGAVAALEQHGVLTDAIDVASVPGAFELPLCAQRMVHAGRYDGIICLGAVIRGETPHFDFVAGEAARGVADVALRLDTPIAFGVLTTDTIEQALARTGGDRGNKGAEAARTVLEMIQLFRLLVRG